MNDKHIYFTSEAVSEGHPDKVADQISDAILDAYLAKDPDSKVACETLVTTGQVIVAGEVKSSATVDVPYVVRETIAKIGYNKPEYKFDGESCGIINLMHEQSADISRGVETKLDPMAQGAGDQGMMFGFATKETKVFMPLPIYLANLFVHELAAIRKENCEMTYLRPDAKSQVTIEYDENGKAVHIDTIVISTQHDEFIIPPCDMTQEEADERMRQRIRKDIEDILIPRVFYKATELDKSLYDENTKLYVNPTGKFVIGGPHGDTGLTGRKIIVDTYGGKGAHGGGAFSGKDPSKVDRSAAYMARYIAKNMVAAGIADEMLVQLSYAIGVAEPVSVHVNTNGTAIEGLTDAAIANAIWKLFDLRPKAIEKKLNLRQPIYEETAAYGHFGRYCTSLNKVVEGESIGVAVFTWEILDDVQRICDYFFPDTD